MAVQALQIQVNAPQFKYQEQGQKTDLDLFCAAKSVNTLDSALIISRTFHYWNDDSASQKVTHIVLDYLHGDCEATLFQYDMIAAYNIDAWKRADTFLLCTHEFAESWQMLNGEFISQLAKRHPVLVFLECAPSQMKVPDTLALRKHLFIEQELLHDVYFFGWDADNARIQPLLEYCTKIDMCEDLQDNVEKDLDDLERAIRVDCPDFGNQRINFPALYEKSEQQIKSLGENMERFVAKQNYQRTILEQMRYLQFKLKQGIDATTPDRISALIITLHSVRMLRSKGELPFKAVFLGCSGLFDTSNGNELLDEELEYHRAVTLLPSID